MLAAILRLFALRPLLSLAIFGIPVVVLIIVGLLAITLVKLLVFVVLPIALVVWLLRRLSRSEPPVPPAPRGWWSRSRSR